MAGGGFMLDSMSFFPTNHLVDVLGCIWSYVRNLKYLVFLRKIPQKNVNIWGLFPSPKFMMMFIQIDIWRNLLWIQNRIMSGHFGRIPPPTWNKWPRLSLWIVNGVIPLILVKEIWLTKSIGFFPSYLKGLYPVAQVVIAGFLNHQEQESLEWVVKHHYSKFITIPFERNNWKFFALSLLKSSQITLCKFWQNDDQNITNTSVSVQYTQYVYVYIYFFCYT